MKSVGDDSSNEREVVVEFDEEKEWRGTEHDLEYSSTPTVGDKVQVKLSVTEPYLKWGGVKSDDVGTLLRINDELEIGSV